MIHLFHNRSDILEKCYPGYGWAMMTLKKYVFLEPRYRSYGLAMNAVIASVTTVTEETLLMVKPCLHWQVNHCI